MQPKHRCVFLTLVFILFSANAFSAENTTDWWQSVVLGEKKIGYRHISRSYTKNRIQTLEVMEFQTKVPGEPIRDSKITMEYLENRDGEPMGISKKVESNTANYRMQGKVSRGKWQVSLKNRSSREQHEFELPSNFLFGEMLRQKLLEKTQASAMQLEYSAWSFSALAFEAIELEWQPYRSEEYSDVAWKVSRRKSQAAVDTTLYADENFNFLHEESVASGEPLVINTCGKACALAKTTPLKNVYSQLIRSPYRIPDSALHGTVRYTLQSDAPLSIPSTDEQWVREQGDSLLVDVCGDCGSEPAPSASELEAALADNFWLDYRDRKLQGVVKRLFRKKSRTPEEKMYLLERFVTRHMKRGEVNYAGYASASEAYRSASGDCTEQAVLLAALGRAAGVPTRLALGTAYSNERFFGRSYVFVPHTWVQAWVGDRWQSFDSGMEGFTAGHITLGLSNGEQQAFMQVMQSLRSLKIVSAAQVKRKSD